jgi:hypothetical protein
MDPSWLEMRAKADSVVQRVKVELAEVGVAQVGGIDIGAHPDLLDIQVQKPVFGDVVVRTALKGPDRNYLSSAPKR